MDGLLIYFCEIYNHIYFTYLDNKIKSERKLKENFSF